MLLMVWVQPVNATDFTARKEAKVQLFSFFLRKNSLVLDKKVPKFNFSLLHGFVGSQQRFLSPKQRKAYFILAYMC